MLMEGQVKFFSLQNTAGLLQEKGIAIIPQTTEKNGDLFSNTIINSKIPPALTDHVVFKNVTDAMFLASLFAETGVLFTCTHMHTPSEAGVGVQGKTNESLQYLLTCIYMLLGYKFTHCTSVPDILK